MHNNSSQVFESLLLENFIVFCSPLTITLNSTVLLIAIKYVNFNVRLEQIFVVSMTISDFIFGTIFMTTVKFHADIPSWLCRHYYALVWMSGMGSTMFLLLLNIHKLVTLFYPLHSKIFVTKKRVLFQNAICWSFIIFAAIFYTTEPRMVLRFESRVPCAVVPHPIHYVFMVLIFYVIPSMLSTVISSAVFVLAQKKARKSENLSKERRKLFKRILFVFTSTFWTSLTCIPYRVMVMKIQLCRSISNDFWSYSTTIEEKTENYVSDNLSNYSLLIFDQTGNGSSQLIVNLNSKLSSLCSNENLDVVKLFQALLIIGTVVNPLITLLTQERYRKGTVRLFRWFTRKPSRNFQRRKTQSLFCTTLL